MIEMPPATAAAAAAIASALRGTSGGRQPRASEKVARGTRALQLDDGIYERDYQYVWA